MPELPLSFWVGKDASGGIPNPGRPDVVPPPHWRLATIWATERPRHLDVSPDGTSLALIVDRDSSDVWTMPVAGGPPARLSVDRPLAPFWEDDGPRWSPDSWRVAYSSGGAVHVVAAGGGTPRRICDGSSPVWIDDRRLVVSTERADPDVIGGEPRSVLVEVDIDDRWPVGLAVGPGDSISAVVSPDGAHLAYELHPRSDLNRSEIHVIDLAARVDTALVVVEQMHARGPAWSPDGSTIAYVCESPGWYEVFVAAADSATAPRQVTADDADFGDLTWFPDGRRMLATRTREGRSDIVIIDGETGSITTLAAGGSFSSVRLAGESTVVAVHEAYDTAPRVVRLDASGAAPGELTVMHAPTPAAIRAAPHVRPEHVSYRSLDGTTIPGLLFRPPAASPDAPCPAVVYPHGGPTSCYGDEWDGVAQYFLDKGYAWFAINYRGSTTYGRAFERADHGVWGVADTQDCLAAHDHLATLGWVDPQRVAIFGSSYGSYLALHSVVDDPQHRYRCAVAKYGDCDILTSWAQGDRGGRLDLERMMGHPAEHPDRYAAGSPIHRIEQLAVPILVAHGEQDDRVHPAQSVELVAALDRLGKTYEYVTYPTEGHGLLREGPFVHFYQRLERFLDWYLR